jgi:hypothetical protein
MNKTLKFDTNLIPLVLSGDKQNTWRIFDDKRLATGDTVNFLNTETKEKFASAELTEVTEKTFAELNDHDWAGHEKFENDQKMYEYYSQAYKQSVGLSTKLKIIWFKLI